MLWPIAAWAAEQETRLAEERLTHVKSDYSSGGLSLDDWIEFKAELSRSGKPRIRLDKR